VEKFVDSLVDIHANHSVQQASDKEKKTQDTYGHTSSSTSGQLDLFGAFGKMSKDTPRWGYGESCPIWKKKVIDARSAYSVRKKLAHHTKGNECSSWPTPQASEGKANRHRNNPNAKGSQEWLTTKVMDTWPTPRAGNPGSRKPGTGGKILAEEAKIHNGLQDQEKSNTSGKNHGSPKLNPSWVEQLMGLSTGWTDLGSWGMELSPKQQN
jgi:hypothetical protein